MLQFAAFCASLLVAVESIDIGHNVDIGHFMPCPIFDCIYQQCPSGQYKTNYVTINGHKCPSCSTCVDTSAVSARDLVQLQMPCPIFDCMFLQCPSGQYETRYVTINGKQCPSCPSCMDKTAVARAAVEEMLCPIFDCMLLQNCPSRHFETHYIIVNGKKCPACPLCVDKTAVARAAVFEMPCPIFDCMFLQTCPSGQFETNYVTINGKKCPACPACVDKTAVARAAVSAINFMPCPLFECAMMMCPSGQYHTSYTIINGHKCPTCPTCSDQSILSLRDAKDMGVCPAAMCMATDKCDEDHLQKSYFPFHGHECPGCPTCTDS